MSGVDSDLPTFTGTNDKHGALHEIHIFMADLNPKQDVLQLYYDSVEKWNDARKCNARKCNAHKDKTNYQMKACFLTLVFRDVDGNEQAVQVMQSARYIRSNDTTYVVDQCHQDAEWFTERGLAVVREKIEAKAYGIKEIPLETKDVPNGKYFEFHIKVGRKDRDDSAPIRDSEIEELKKISREFSKQFKIPVPLSYNENKNKFNQDGQGHQRFLNVRFRKGRDVCAENVKAVKDAINDQTTYQVLKVIPEYVWFDTYIDMDKGWIDYTPEELNKMF